MEDQKTQDSEILQNGHDLQQAYFWILGRRPSDWEIQAQSGGAFTMAQMRTTLLKSAEFADQAEDLQLMSAVEANNYDLEEVLPENHTRTIVVDIPLSGTSFIRRLIQDGLKDVRQCPEATNRLALRTALNLGAYDLFIGTYDYLSLRLIPGNQKQVLVMLADPAKRLVALYHYLKASDPHVASHNGFDLCRAAREESLVGFLEAALTINPGAVDNVYARTLGGQISKNDWRQTTSAALPTILSEATERLYMERARDLLSRVFVGLLEHIGESRRRIRHILTIDGEDFPIDERHDGIVYQGEYSWIPPQSDSKAEALINNLTRLDRQLYNEALARFSFAAS